MTGYKPDYRGELAQRVRKGTGRTQKEMAALFGISLRSWQDKEQNESRVNVAELLMFQLLLGEHPDYMLIPRQGEKHSPAHNAAESAFKLAQYLLSDLPLPSQADLLQRDLDAAMGAFKGDWLADVDNAIGSALPDEATVLRAKLADAQEEIASLKRRLLQK